MRSEGKAAEIILRDELNKYRLSFPFLQLRVKAKIYVPQTSRLIQSNLLLATTTVKSVLRFHHRKTRKFCNYDESMSIDIYPSLTKVCDHKFKYISAMEIRIKTKTKKYILNTLK